MTSVDQEISDFLDTDPKSLPSRDEAHRIWSNLTNYLRTRFYAVYPLIIDGHLPSGDDPGYQHYWIELEWTAWDPELRKSAQAWLEERRKQWGFVVDTTPKGLVWDIKVFYRDD